MNKKPFFSIVTRIRNMSDLFDDMFKSLQLQTCQDFELWVLDHHSEDDIKEKIENLKKTNNNIFYKPIENFSDFFNCFEYINGKVFLWLDADDMLRSDCLEKIKECFEKYNLDFLTTNYIYFDNNDYNLINNEKENYYNDKNEHIRRLNGGVKCKNISCKKEIGIKILEDHSFDLNRYPLFDDTIFLMIMEIKYLKNTHLKDILCYYRTNNKKSLTYNDANLYNNYDKETQTIEYSWKYYHQLEEILNNIVKIYNYKYSNYIHVDNKMRYENIEYLKEWDSLYKNKKYFKLEKIENSIIHFKYEKDGEFIFQLYSGDNLNIIEYKTKLDINKNIYYWISHPCLLIEENVKLIIFDKDYNLIEYYIIERNILFNQDDHIVKKIGLEKYKKIKEYLNLSYYEFMQNQYMINEIKIDKENINVIDMGSNIGFLGLFLSDYFILDNYICIEPNERLSYINKIINNDNNKIKKHKIINKIFDSNNDDEINYYLPKDNRYSSIATTSLNFKNHFNDYPDNIILKLKTINFKKIIEESNLEIIDILKIDIEGAEFYLLEDEENIKIIKDKVRYLLIEIHSKEIKNKFLDLFKKDNFFIEMENKLNEDTYLFKIKNHKYIKPKKNNIAINSSDNKKNILLSINCVALGDTICSTPTVRKMSKSYNQKINVRTYRPDVFINNPYVHNIFSFDEKINVNDFDEVFETYNTHICTKCLNKNIDIQIKLSNFEARQLHALGIGTTLYPEEMEYNYTPEEEKEETKKINKDFLIFHITESWANRTWANNKWQRLVDLVKQNTNFKIATIGRHHKEITGHGEIDKKIISLDNIDINFCCEEEGNVKYQNEPNYNNTISDMWHIINNGYALISFDSGPIHLAGTTDTNIIQIGSSIRYEKTAPYRQGQQKYKFYFVGGECKKFCGSDIKYSVKEWGTINSMPYYPECQEKYNEFYCHPTPEQVFFKICEIKE